jgi:hypothetical protein
MPRDPLDQALLVWTILSDKLQAVEYEDTYQDYLNELGARDFLEERRFELTSSQVALLDMSDSTFYANTVDVGGIIFRGRHYDWWRRIPARIEEEEREGFPTGAHPGLHLWADLPES